LSLVGLNQSFDFEDELRSLVPSSSLESLRDLVVSWIPDAEEFASRAMLNALLNNVVASDVQNLCSSQRPKSPIEIEAEMIQETIFCMSARPFTVDRTELVNAVLNEQIESAFQHVDHNRLTIPEALRAILSLATILKLRRTHPVADNVVIILDLPQNTTTCDIAQSLAKFGEIENVATIQNASFGTFQVKEVVAHEILFVETDNEF
jgi:hypothetical protein